MKKYFAIFLLIASWTKAQTTFAAALDENYREVSYEDLLQEINSKKVNIVRDQRNPFDNIMVHAGLGYVNSYSNFRTASGNLDRYQNGIQLSVGVDLFSEHWFGEGAFRNFGLTKTGNEELYTKEIDLKAGYQDKLQDLWNWTASAGLATRYVTIQDFSAGVNIDDTTPSAIGSLGIKGQLNKFLSIGVETSVRSSLIQRTSDRYGMDLTFKLQGSM